MRKTAKYLAGASGIALTVIVAVAVRKHDPATTPIPNPPQLQVQSSPSPQPSLTGTAPDQPTPAVAANDETVIPPLPAGATSVPDADLLKLSALVNLPNAEERHIDKERWSRAVPIAQKLAQGPCDCEQRNWLVNFIDMGNSALAGSDDKYYRLAGLMQKMARNDKQFEKDPAFFTR